MNRWHTPIAYRLSPIGKIFFAHRNPHSVNHKPQTSNLKSPPEGASTPLEIHSGSDIDCENTPHGITKKKNFLVLAGFTFVELFVVIAIFSLLSLALYATFASGIKVWRKIQETTLLKRKSLLSLERFSEDLRQIPDFPKVVFSGAHKELSFPLVFANAIYKITYFVERGSLFRKEQNFKDILEKSDLAKTRQLVSDIEDLQFSYAYLDSEKKEYYFKDTWEPEDGMPFAVKIDLRTKEDYFVKTILLNLY